MSLSTLLQNLRCSLLRIESSFLRISGLDSQLAPAVSGPSLLPRFDQQNREQDEEPDRNLGLLDGILWMAAPKKRRTIEINRTRRRDESKLITVKKNIEPCPECGHLKQNHILCGFCYAKVCKETALIRQRIQEMEGGPLKAPTVETVVLYDGETASEQDGDKRIVERPRKRPAWFSH